MTEVVLHFSYCKSLLTPTVAVVVVGVQQSRRLSCA